MRHGVRRRGRLPTPQIGGRNPAYGVASAVPCQQERYIGALTTFITGVSGERS